MRKELKANPLIKKYLDRVCSKIKGAHRKREVIEELLSHFEEELHGKSLNCNDEIEILLAKFGEPEALGLQLQKARNTILQKVALWFAIGSAAAFGLLLVNAQSLIERFKTNQKEYSQKVEVQGEWLRAQQSLFKQNEFFRETSDVKSDAGAILNSLIPWTHQTKANEFEIFKQADVKAWGRNWHSDPIPESLKSIDTSWISNLKHYDHWDLNLTGPGSVFIGERAQNTGPYYTPVLDVTLLIPASRLHLRRNFEATKIVPALKEIRHLARLAFTTENILGTMIAQSLLRLESRAVEEAINRKLLDPSDYVSLNSKELDQIKKVFHVSNSFNNGLAVAPTISLFQDSKVWPVGGCTILNEIALKYLISNELLSKRYPFEDELKAQMVDIQGLFEISKPYCRLTYGRHIISQSNKYSSVLFDSGPFYEGFNWRWSSIKFLYFFGRYIPYVRQGLGAWLLEGLKTGDTTSHLENI